MGMIQPEKKAELPAQLKYLFEIYMKIRFSRVPNDDGFSLVARDALNYQAIDFYSRNTGLNFEAWEIDTLMNLDSIFEGAANGS